MIRHILRVIIYIYTNHLTFISYNIIQAIHWDQHVTQFILSQQIDFRKTKHHSNFIFSEDIFPVGHKVTRSPFFEVTYHDISYSMTTLQHYSHLTKMYFKHQLHHKKYLLVIMQFRVYIFCYILPPFLHFGPVLCVCVYFS